MKDIYEYGKKWLKIVVKLQFSCRKFWGPPSSTYTKEKLCKRKNEIFPVETLSEKELQSHLVSLVRIHRIQEFLVQKTSAKALTK